MTFHIVPASEHFSRNLMLAKDIRQVQLLAKNGAHATLESGK